MKPFDFFVIAIITLIGIGIPLIIVVLIVGSTVNTTIINQVQTTADLYALKFEELFKLINLRTKKSDSFGDDPDNPVPTMVTAIYAAAPDPILVVRRDYVVVWANSHTFRIFGYPEDQLIGKQLDILVPEEVRGKHRIYFQNFFTSQTRVRPMAAGLFLSGVTYSGQRIQVHISLNRVTDDYVVAQVRTPHEPTEPMTIGSHSIESMGTNGHEDE